MKKIMIVLLSPLFLACESGERKEDAKMMSPTSKEDVSYAEEPADFKIQDNSYDEMKAQAVPDGSETDKTVINAEIGDETKIQPKLIKTADLRFRVKDVEISTDAIEEKAKKFGGFVSNSSLHSNNTEVSNYITIRVPSDGFDALMKEICSESEYMEKKEISTEDVTEEYVDIQTRLKTKKEVEQRYIQILKEKAKTVEDVYLAEEQIRIIREEIEAKEGRLNYLSNQVSYSTISIDIFQHVEYQDNPEELTYTFGHRLQDSVGSGWNVVVDIFLGILSLWPLWIVSAIIYWYVRRKIKNYKPNKS